MTNKSSTAELAVFAPREDRLAKRSALFEAGPISGAKSDASFILRLNTVLARRNTKSKIKPPSNISDGISRTGALDSRAELVAFGRWLLLEGRPNIKGLGGRQPDLRTILKCVAVAQYELRVRPKLKELGLFQAGRESRTREITKRGLALRWPVLFEGQKETSFFDAKLRSMERILSAYLEHLQSGAFVIDGKSVRSSPEIERVLEAITSKRAPKPEPKASTMATPETPVSANLAPFDIELRYSSRAQEEEYRNLTGIALPPSHLRYVPTPVSSISTRGNLRADRQDKVILKPDVAIRENYKTEALIDRLVIVVTTTNVTAAHFIHDKVLDETGANIFAHDLKKRANKADWRASLPELEPTKPSGQHFAIMIQDPTPELLSAILDALRDNYGIFGQV